MRIFRAAALAAVLSVALRAQLSAPAPPVVLLVGSFRTPLSYEAALDKLDSYYQEQIGRHVALVLPQIAPATHYELWHDMWVSFVPGDGGLKVVLTRLTEGATVVTAKGWMLQISGALSGELPLRFEERPALHSAESEIAGSQRDVARALKTQPSLHAVDSWQYAGLLVSYEPMVRIELAPAGPRGTHRLTVTAGTAAGARQLAAAINAAMSGPCICAVYSETAGIDQELQKTALEKSEDVNATTAQRIYLSRMDPKQVEVTLRADPEMRKRLAAAEGWVDIRYRVDKPYASVRIRWSELNGYSRATGKFDGERPIGASTTANVRPPVSRGAQLTARTKLAAPLRPGAYRIAIEGVTSAGQIAPIDSRDYWFDGKTFEEL